jgi:GT2 family glycosyltransferase
VFTDADVISPESSLEEVVARFTSDRDLCALSACLKAPNGDRGFFDRYKSLFVHDIFARTPESICYLWTSFAAVRADIFRSTGGFSTRYRYAGWEDVELGLRIADDGGRILNCRAIEVEHRHHYSLGSLVSNDLRRIADFAELLLAKRRTIRQLRGRGKFLLQHEKLAVPFSMLFWGSLVALMASLWAEWPLPIRTLCSAASAASLFLVGFSRRASLRLALRVYGPLFAFRYFWFSSALSIVHGLAVIHGTLRHVARNVTEGDRS